MNIQKNQIFTVKITDMGTDGEGIGHLEDSDALSGNGYTLFVKDAVLGDTVRAKVVKPKKGYAFAGSNAYRETRISSVREVIGELVDGFKKALEERKTKHHP